MTEADIDAVSAVRVQGWQAAYPGLMPQAYLDAMSVARDAAERRSRFGRRLPQACDLVAVREGAVAGWAALGPARDPDLSGISNTPGSPGVSDAPGAAPPAAEPPADRPAAGELFALYVTPGLIGTGIGRALLTAGLDRARAAGWETLCLWVVRGNTRARRFYERAGFVPDGAEEAYEVAGVSVPEVRYRRPVASGAGPSRRPPAPSAPPSPPSPPASARTSS
ncbi:GNAT family N-acetyltransferase [Streptomyces celluloflavus]|uniref:GNAT family N-acetyltransferase n=1 Tax=Streptomyces celluloflavus TaxID=58344 RepID=A0ABW7RFE3_9ACTN